MVGLITLVTGFSSDRDDDALNGTIEVCMMYTMCAFQVTEGTQGFPERGARQVEQARTPGTDQRGDMKMMNRGEGRRSSVRFLRLTRA